MGEIADMMLDGTLCEGCGVALGGRADGFPRRCGSCRREANAERHAQVLAEQQRQKKVRCPDCGRKVKSIGLADHRRDAHGITGAPS